MRSARPAFQLLKNRLVLFWCVYCTKSEPIFKTKVNRTRGSAWWLETESYALICAPRPLPAVAGAKTKNFPYLSSFPRRGVWGGAGQKWKGNFWFCFAASDYKMNICIISLCDPLELFISPSLRRDEALPLGVW